MKLAISNIAWAWKDFPLLVPALRELGVEGIEVAPTKLWPSWDQATKAAAIELRKRLDDEGFSVPAIQSIFFGRNELQLFDNSTWLALEEHVKHVADLAQCLGARVLVFGSPKMRRRGQLSMSQAMPPATDIFRRLGAVCLQRGVCIGLEHNPPEYGCDFATCAADVVEIVKCVDSAGVAVHLDSGGLQMSGGDIGKVICDVGHFVHYHVSEPMLVNPSHGSKVDHRKAAGALATINYPAWISLEMQGQETHDDISHALSFVRDAYRPWLESSKDW
jgi:sugar phosphate isomerase/epimerase